MEVKTRQQQAARTWAPLIQRTGPGISLVLLANSLLLAGLVPPTASAQTFPFVIPGDDALAAITNQSRLLSRPAGRAGFVQIKDGHFYTGSKRLRFWGVNICFGSNFPSHDEAEVVAAHMAKLGINAVRFHHMDNQAAPGGIWSPRLRDGKRVFDPERVDRLDYFLAQLHDNGIYADINLHVSRELKPEEGFPKLKDVPWWATYNKWAMYYDKDIQSHLKEYCRNLLMHKNRYRDGLARVNDPGIAVIEMLNENFFSQQGYSLYRSLPKRYQDSFLSAWNDWLVAKYGNTSSLIKAWSAKRTSMGTMIVKPAAWRDDLGSWYVSLGQDKIARSFGRAAPSVLPTILSAIQLTPTEVTENDYHQQLSLTNLSTRKDQPLTLSYWIRSDRKRPYHVELSSSQGGSWRDVGIYEQLQATPAWRKVTRVLFPQETVRDAVSLSFSFGTSTAPIEIAGVTLQEGSFVADLPASQTLESRSVAVPDAQSDLAAHTDMKQFMVETEVAWIRELKRFLIDDLGVQVPITASQVSYHTPQVNDELNDFVDMHNYWHHPVFPSDANWDPKRWTVGNEAMEARPFATDWPASSLLMRMGERYEGKPMTLSEWNYPEPSPYSSGCVPMAATLAALQDWDGVFFFDYDSGSQQPGSWTRNQTINFFSFNGQPVKLAAFSVFANLFVRSDLKPITRSVVAPPNDPVSGRHGLNYRLSVSTNVKSKPDLPPAGNKTLATADQSVVWNFNDQDKGQITVNTPRTQAAWGTLSESSVQTSDISFTIGSLRPDYAAIAVTSQDDLPIGRSNRMVLLASTHSENQIMGWNDERSSVGNNWGHGPTRVLGISANIAVRNKSLLEVHALDGTGKRIESVPVRHDRGLTYFQIDPKYQTLWYEVSAARK